jgi:predicted dehydrogenase
LPVFAKAKSLLDSGVIGTLTAISHRHSSPAHRRDSGWRVDVAQSGGGLFMDLASHVFDALDYITGPFKDVHSHASRVSGGAGAEEVIGVTWRNDRNVVGASLWNFASDQSEDVIELVGTEGKISWASFGAGVVKVLRGDTVETFDAPNPPHVHQPLVQTIVDESLGRGKCPSTGVSAHRTQVVLDQCLNAYYGGREDAFWLRPHTWNQALGA